MIQSRFTIEANPIRRIWQGPVSGQEKARTFAASPVVIVSLRVR